MRVSIVIPVYNAEKFIVETLDSIFKQSICNEMEIICVDDGSTDKSASLIKDAIKKNNNNLRYYYQENGGAPSARNKGLSLAKGKYVMFFDADDILLDNAVEELAKAAERDMSDVVFGSFDVVNEIGQFKWEERAPQELNDKWEILACSPNPGNKLYDRKFLIKNKLRFLDLTIGQDLNFFLKAIVHTNKISIVPTKIMKYREVDGSISRIYTTRILGICDCMNDVREYYFQNGLCNVYNDYIEIIELRHYLYQLKKIIYFKKGDEIKEVKKSLLFQQKKVSILNKNNFFERIKIKIKILLWVIGIGELKQKLLYDN